MTTTTWMVLIGLIGSGFALHTIGKALVRALEWAAVIAAVFGAIWFAAKGIYQAARWVVVDVVVVAMNIGDWFRDKNAWSECHDGTNNNRCDERKISMDKPIEEPERSFSLSVRVELFFFADCEESLFKLLSKSSCRTEENEAEGAVGGAPGVLFDAERRVPRGKVASEIA